MRTILALAAAAYLTACTTGEQIGGIHEGMSPDQVSATLGNPDGVAREGNQLTYHYANRLMSGWSWDKADYVMVFEGDRLSQWGPVAVRQQAPNHGMPIAGAALLQTAIQPDPISAPTQCVQNSLGVTCY